MIKLTGESQPAKHIMLNAIIQFKKVTLESFLIIYNQSNATALQWRHNERDDTSNHQPQYRLLKRLFKAQIKENTKAPRHWHLWGEFTGDR